MLNEIQLDGTVYSKEERAVERLKTMAPIAERLYGGYTVMVSGGKDSTVITDLAVRSGVKCSFSVSWTGIEHPETVYFLRREKQRLEAMGYSFEFYFPRDKDGGRITMWKLIEGAGFPCRQRRFCCAKLKEANSVNKYVVLGVRWAESPNRKTCRKLHEEYLKGRSREAFISNNDNEAWRRWQESCAKKREFILNPIIEWSDDEVWEYIHARKLPYNPLYDAGHKRVGCIGCPLRPNLKDFEDNPRFASLYRKAGEKSLRKLRAKCPEKYSTGIYENADTYFEAWIRHACGTGRMKADDENDFLFGEEA